MAAVGQGLLPSGRRQGRGSSEHRRWLTQAGGELLLAQSSDWSFILRAGTTTGLARERIHRHLDRFWRLMDAIENGTPLPSPWLAAVEREDSLFPSLEAADWATRPSLAEPSALSRRSG